MIDRIEKKWVSYEESENTNNTNVSNKKSQDNSSCSICGRTGHPDQVCAAKVQIFEWPYPTKGDIYLCGDFSFWQIKHLMHPPDKDHEFTWLQLNLAPSKYQYKFLVDGVWLHDSKKPTITDQNGILNNIVEVTPVRFEESDEEDDEAGNASEYSVLIEKKEPVAKVSMKNVRITYPFDANWVTLKGSWDDWLNEIPLKKIKNNITGHYEFYVKLRVPLGTYEYKFLVNGRWMVDPNKKKVKNPFGNENNLIEVTIKSHLSKISPTFLEKNKLLKWERLVLDYKLPADFKHLMQGHSMSIIGEEVYVFGGMRNKDFTNSMYILDLITSEIISVDQNGPIPSRRAFHGAIVFYSKIIIYGGFNEKAVLTDYHVFNTANQTWLESPKLGGEQPPMRERFSLVSYHEQNLILFGGYYCSEDLEFEEHYSDVYALHLGSLEWHKIDCEGEVPQGRFAHSASIIQNSMFVFGGVAREKSRNKNFNDVFQLKLRKKESRMKWKKIEVKGTPPEPRHGHTAIVANMNIVIFGGRGNLNKLFGELHILDTVNSMWFHPSAIGDITDIPQPRFYHSCQLLSNQSEILLLGGYKKEFHQSRFFKLSPIEKEEESHDEEQKLENASDEEEKRP